MAFSLYIDEDAMSRALVYGLRIRGVDVTTVLDAGLKGEDDEPQLIFATEKGRVLFSYNVGHFCRLHSLFLQQGRQHSGIIVVQRLKMSIGQQIRGLMRLVNTRTAVDMENGLEFLHE